MQTIFPLLPIIIPFGGAVISLALYKWRRVQALWSFFAMVSSMVVSGFLLFTVWNSARPLVLQVGGWGVPAGISVVGDLLSASFVFMSQMVLSMGFLYALGAKDKCVQIPTFYPLFLCLGTGLSGAFLTGDIFNLFVFVELMVISGAALTALSDDQNGTEAAYKYFIISVTASLLLLMACALLYVAFGTLNIAQLSQLISNSSGSPTVHLALIFLTVFFMVKSAVIPFHFWQPDFHTAAPTPVHAVLSSVVVKIGVYGFIRLMTLSYADPSPTLKAVLLVTGCAGALLGGLGALGTYDAKRMLAYSTIGQIGFICAALGWGTLSSFIAAIVFSFNHSLIKAAMLMLAGAVASRAPVKTAAFEKIVGLGRSIPLAGVFFIGGSMGLAGLPPINGFVSKMAVFRAGVEVHDFFPIALLGLAGFITLLYSARAYQRIWWEPLPAGISPKKNGDRLWAPGLLIFFCFYFGFQAEPVVRLATQTVQSITQPEIYINAVLGER